VLGELGEPGPLALDDLGRGPLDECGVRELRLGALPLGQGLLALLAQPGRLARDVDRPPDVHEHLEAPARGGDAAFRRWTVALEGEGLRAGEVGNEAPVAFEGAAEVPIDDHVHVDPGVGRDRELAADGPYRAYELLER